MEPDRGRPQIERLGKKYQWMALDELVCRLADNHWISDYGGDTRRYDYPPDVGFFRDIDPTIVIQEPPSPAAQWMTAPEIVVEPDATDRWKWPFEIDRGPELEHLISRRDQTGRVWLTVYEHQHANEPKKNRGEVESLRVFGREEFRFVCLALVRQKDCDQLVQSVNRTRSLDIQSWAPPEFTDAPYLLEAPWRPTWSAETWVNDGWRGQIVPVAFPISEYMWESHLDLALDNGHREFVPSPWLMGNLSLTRRLGGRGEYQDSSGLARMIQGSSGHDGTVVLFDWKWFESFLHQESLKCIWLYLNERNSFLGDSHGAWRRTEGVAWIENAAVRSLTWRDDRTRNDDNH